MKPSSSWGSDGEAQGDLVRRVYENDGEREDNSAKWYSQVFSSNSHFSAQFPSNLCGCGTKSLHRESAKGKVD